jgi:hypothetical protein
MKRLSLFSMLLVLAATSSAPAQMAMPAATPAAAKLSDKPAAAEQPFITGISTDLPHRFPTASDAEKAGYLRYTLEDSTGAISYANREWSSTDPKHPSQLWYDVKGRILGADFSVLAKDSPSAPKLWGVDPSRWVKIGTHVHYGVAGPNGSITYGGVGPKKFAAAGGDIAHPQPADLVKLGVAKDVKDVQFIFTVPANWDLVVWVIANPNGAFADANPDVKPSANAQHGEM